MPDTYTDGLCPVDSCTYNCAEDADCLTGEICSQSVYYCIAN